MVVAACKQLYNPPSISSPGSYLVVEGVINTGTDSTVIKLSYTVKLTSKVSLTPAQHAQVVVQSDQNTSYPLIESSSGRYVSASLNLDNSHKYRLSIKTTNNEQYYSDYVPVLNSPPMDSVYYQITNSGINIKSTTHDPTNAVQYYRWDYQETWIIHADYNSQYASNGDTVLARAKSNEIYTCWQSETSSSIVLNSTANLKQAVLTDNPITALTPSSEKLGVRYSILVTQYALTAEAYSFWTNLKKNTEQLGSIFDAQPSQINGNIHSASNPAEPVLGYISAGAVSSQRIFLDKQQLPTWQPTTPYGECELDTFLYRYLSPGSKVPINQVNQNINYKKGGGGVIPVSAVTTPFGTIIGFTGSTSSCTDCTLRGSNKQPAFWTW